MTVESEADLDGLKKIGRIVAETLHEMKKNLRPGMTTAELDAVGEAYLRKHGARSAPVLVYHFPGTTCISLNDEAAHGIPGERVIQPGDLVNLDVSAELDGYFADTAATVIVPPADPQRQRLIRSTQRALVQGINAARAGALINAIGRAIEMEATRSGFSVLRDLGGHGVGRSIHELPHDVSCFYNRLDHRRLSEGLVITIEPFLTISANHVVAQPDGWTLKTNDGSLSAQFEHTLVIRRGRPTILTAL